MKRHLLMRLQAPLIAFGGEAIDRYGIIRDFPAQSMLTGLFANALGWCYEDAVLHNRLQERLVFGARLETVGGRLTDFQTAKLAKDDLGWTTRGVPEGRNGGDATYDSPHLRFRDFLCDASVLVALRLEPAEEAPNLDDLAAAVDRPARPLFLGRKPCLPSRRLFAGWLQTPTILEALQRAELETGDRQQRLRAQWPDGEGEQSDARLMEICDERDWHNGVHGGWRPVREGLITPGVSR